MRRLPFPASLGVLLAMALAFQTPSRAASSIIKTLESLADQGLAVEIRALAVSTVADAQFPASDRLVAALLESGLGDAPLEPGLSLAAGLRRIGDAAIGLDAAAQVEACHQAGKILMRLRRYPAVRQLLAQTAAQYRPLPENVYPCRFVEKAPAGVDAWLASPILQDPARIETRFEPYDQAAARLLVHDVNSEREDVRGDATAPAGKGTVFAMAWDSDGWHLFIRCDDPESPMVAAGLVPGGQLELFFRPGEDTAYYQWFVGFPAVPPKSVSWDSPHTAYRPLDDYYKVQTAVLGDGFAARVLIPWEMVYDKLPREGDRWPFGLMRWSRLGSVTWGGKVHELQKFGRIEWQGMDTARLMGIKRQIVMNALGRYRAVRSDIASFWKDEQKGDPVFFGEVLLPFLERLDADGKTVGMAMSDAVVEDLFRETVPLWMEFPHRVASLRRQYLQAALLH